ncbi:MAG: hypothetical protein ACP6IY_15665 [Promethearchaeia archaeon]
MEKKTQLLDLDDNALKIYFNCLGKGALTFNELRAFIKNISVMDMHKIIEQLMEKNLLVAIEPKNNKFPIHYTALAPIELISKTINKIIKFLKASGGNLQIAFRDTLEKVIEKQELFNADILVEKIDNLIKNFDREAEGIRKELEELIDNAESNNLTSDFLINYEKELKNLMYSEIAGILIPILQFKEEFKEKYTSIGITDQQWDAVKDEIKNILAKNIHEKTQEIVEIISDEFEEIRKYFDEKIKISFQNKFEQKSVYLGMINLFKNELIKFKKTISEELNSIKERLSILEKTINSNLLETYEKLISNYSEEIDSIENIIKELLKHYSKLKKSDIERLNTFYSIEKVKELIDLYLSKSKTELIIIVPNIKEYIPLEKIPSFSQKIIIKIAATEAHNDENVKFLEDLENVEYKKIKNNNFIGLISDYSEASIGFYEVFNGEPYIIGFSTDYTPFIDLLKEIISEKWEKALYEDDKQIKKDLNEILENINDYTGWKIGEILHNIIKIAEKKEGLSFHLVELKILRNKLRKINLPLDNELKKKVIEHVEKLSEYMGKIELIKPEIRLPKDSKPELEIQTEAIKNGEKEFMEDDFIKSELELSSKMTIESKKLAVNLRTIAKQEKIIESKKTTPITSATSEKAKLEDTAPKSEEQIFYEKFEHIENNIDDIKGSELGKKLQEIMDIILEKEGFSVSLNKIKYWINKLKFTNAPLNEDFKKEFLEDFGKFREKYAPKKEIKEEEKIVPSFLNVEKQTATSEKPIQGKKLTEMFDELIVSVPELKGPQISKKLQDIADILLEAHGALATREIRTWISKLRSIRADEKEKINPELISKIATWKDKFCKD